MYHQYVLKEENQNPTTTWIQEAANFLIQTGQTFGDVGWILTRIGDFLLAIGNILSSFLGICVLVTDKRFSCFLRLSPL